MSQRPDPITVEVIAQRLAGIVQEMQNSLFRTGYSTIIRESRDASCAILDRAGRVVAQHTVLPLHLGAFPASVEGLFQFYRSNELEAGDSFLVNHPYFGGSPHAPDMVVLSPILVDGELFGFSASMAHKSDIGGTVPGSGSGQAREIYHEGLHIPPVRFYLAGEPLREVETIIRANTRTPDLVMGDLRGQVGATRLGVERVQELCAQHGGAMVAAATERQFELTERRVRSAVAAWADGEYEGEAFLDDDGVQEGRPVRVHVRITIQGERVRFDLRASDDQTPGPVNIRPPLVLAACYYCLICLIDPEMPANHGLAAAVEAEFRPGSVLCPQLPAPVNTYIPTAQAVVEATFRALAGAVPRARLAESGGTGAIALGGSSHRRGYVQYELFGSGFGARSDKDGVSATTVHVGNSAITPLEIVETEFPVEVLRFELIPDSGGAGRQRGGLGFVREYRVLGESRLSVRGDKHATRPRGREGGLDGRAGAAVVNPGSPLERRLPARAGDVQLQAGDVLRIERAGGGGYGEPLSRPPEMVLRDVREGYVSSEAARGEYGVALVRSEHTWELDEVGTAALRAEPSVPRP